MYIIELLIKKNLRVRVREGKDWCAVNSSSEAQHGVC